MEGERWRGGEGMWMLCVSEDELQVRTEAEEKSGAMSPASCSRTLGIINLKVMMEKVVAVVVMI